MPTERPNLYGDGAPPAPPSHTIHARRDATEHCLAEARRLAHEVEELLVEAAKDPSVDAYALRIAQGLARSLIDQLVERPASSRRLEARLATPGGSNRGGNGSAQVA